MLYRLIYTDTLYYPDIKHQESIQNLLVMVFAGSYGRK